MAMYVGAVPEKAEAIDCKVDSSEDDESRFEQSRMLGRIGVTSEEQQVSHSLNKQITSDDEQFKSINLY